MLNSFLLSIEIFNVCLTECKRAHEWSSSSFVNLHAPLAPSVSLQWVYRDGVLLNLPTALLVEGDAILLRPGQVVPANCRQINPVRIFFLSYLILIHLWCVYHDIIIRRLCQMKQLDCCGYEIQKYSVMFLIFAVVPVGFGGALCLCNKNKASTLFSIMDLLSKTTNLALCWQDV